GLLRLLHLLLSGKVAGVGDLGRLLGLCLLRLLGLLRLLRFLLRRQVNLVAAVVERRGGGDRGQARGAQEAEGRNDRGQFAHVCFLVVFRRRQVSGRELFGFR